MLLTWELDCRWGKEKVEETGMTGQVEVTLEAGDESTQEKVKKKETLEPEHKEQQQENNTEDPEEITVCSLSNNMGDYKGACDSRCFAA